MVSTDNIIIGDFTNLALAIGGSFLHVVSGPLEIVSLQDMEFTKILGMDGWFEETLIAQYMVRTRIFVPKY